MPVTTDGSPGGIQDQGSFATINAVNSGAANKGTRTSVGNSVTRLGTGFGVVDTTLNSDDGFHVFRLAQEGSPNNGEITMWRDGVVIATGFNADFAHPAVTFQFGDIGGNYSAEGGTVEVDYFRWTTGAFAPIPEPSSVILMLLGFCSMVRVPSLRRTRRGGS